MMMIMIKNNGWINSLLVLCNLCGTGIRPTIELSSCKSDLTQILFLCHSLQNLTHAMTAVLSCHMQNFAVITLLQLG